MEFLNKIFEKLLAILPSIVMVEPTERGARLSRGGKYRIIGPGLYIVWPIVQRVIRMDVITQVVDLAPQTIRTKDGIELVVSGIIRYRIIDIEKALFAVQDLDKALSTLALAVILEYVRIKTMNECEDTEAVKKELRHGLAEAASGWGVKIETVGLTDWGRVRSVRLFGDNLRFGV